MSSIYDWQKQFDTINRTTNMLNSISDQIGIVSRFGGMSSLFEAYSNQLNALSSINNVQITSGLWNRQFKTYRVLQGMDFSNIFGMQESMKNMMTNYDFSALTSTFENFNKLNNSSSIANMYSAIVSSSAALRVYDSFKFTNAIQNAFSKFDWSNSIHVLDILEEVTEQYILDNELDETASEEIRDVVTIKDGKLLTNQQRKVWEVYIYPFLVSLFFFILSSNQPQSVDTTNIIEVNNYYTVEVGMDVNTLNDYNFRMIYKDNVMPRIKPDCSSRVVGHLPMGKIVCVVDKYKKWIEITWKNDEGEYFSGWIQNYKIVEFKER
ncbi:MAG: hypothetical protein PHE02_10570 [Lachnospiraceae bacterium]|nr:hypothetical protein [Lachnospiraceae bacterium]